MIKLISNHKILPVLLFAAMTTSWDSLEHFSSLYPLCSGKHNTALTIQHTTISWQMGHCVLERVYVLLASRSRAPRRFMLLSACFGGS